MDEEALEREMARRCAVLAERSGLSVPPLPRRGEQGEGEYFHVVDGEIRLEHRERGRVSHVRVTTDPEEFLWWVFDDATSQMAHLEARAVQTHGDARRAWFPRWVEVIGLLDPAWAARTEEHIEDLLARAPFHDA